ADGEAEKVLYPCFDDPRERVERGSAEGDADHRVVARLALPVDLRVRLVQHVEVNLAERALGFHDQPSDAAVLAAGGMHLDGLEVGEKRVAFLDRRLLLAEEDLRRT